ncbi:hypothetical protein GS982_01585 [Rhodococcus hoagii]|uniref:Uncharacterized protein n=1 Tax=Rhodococcus hoagii TaxID=43767 RepID=A0A9Q4ZIK5_RHOHA|nr:hypothetical protein [Prescottella equi]NKT77289.1 hypothetical protein [Prescottella equi]NKZ81076.1 hypothetical protein [Prescottella equi]
MSDDRGKVEFAIGFDDNWGLDIVAQGDEILPLLEKAPMHQGAHLYARVTRTSTENLIGGRVVVTTETHDWVKCKLGFNKGDTI